MSKIVGDKNDFMTFRVVEVENLNVSMTRSH